jgi:short-subunit dehydrogenase
LRGKVVVITGASSGIGRAAAEQFADAGCRVVLAARRTAALDEVAQRCQARGADAAAVPTDVTRPADLERLLDETLERFGRVDVWVNNAGTTLFGGLDAGDFAAHRQVLETNLLAPMYAARLLLPVFRRQRAGTLINLGSVLSSVGQPFVPSYVISKFGVLGLSEAVRAEVADEPAIDVCTILPYAVNTAHFEDGANVIGKRAYAMPPAQDPADVAAAIVEVAARPRRLRYVPRYAAAGVLLHWLLPGTTERVLHHALRAFHLAGTQPPTHGHLFQSPDDRGTVRGGRGPIVSLPVLLAWIAGDLLGTGVGRLSRWHRRWPRLQSTR